jgi:acetylornithine/succinyldiaminopimelate/putrescine aminotransferase
LPLGATVAREDVMSAFKLGDHSTTYSGNPLVCAAGCAAIDVLLEEKMVERAAKQGAYFKAELEKLLAKHKSLKEVRGLGLMLGMESKFDVLNILLKAKDRGVLVLDAGKTVVRFLPPFVITTEQIDKAVTVLDGVLEEEENARASGASPN